MDPKAEIETLKRQNRRLKTALFSSITVLLIGVLTAAGIAGTAAVRARAEVLRALEMQQQARAQAEAAFAKAQQTLDEVDAQDDSR